MTLEIVKLALIVIVPGWLLITRQHKKAILWLGIVSGIEVLDTNVLASISAVNAFGLICLPFVLPNIPEILATRAGKLVMFGFLLLMMLGLVYGYTYPWPDITRVRPWNQLSQGRSLIYSIRHLSELGLALYIADQVRTPGQLRFLLLSLLTGTTIVAIGVIIEGVSSVDIYPILVPSGRALNIGRFRGFTGEPRTASQFAAIGLLLLITIHNLQYRLILYLTHVTALALTLATTGLILFTIGVIIILVQGRFRASKLVTQYGLFSVAVFILLYVPFRPNLASWGTDYSAAVESRLVSNYSWNRAVHAGDWLANQLEPFDGAAVLFLWENPKYLLFGTGPGLVSLPASRYIPLVHQAVWGSRIDSIPHMGLLLIIANTGIIGFSLWVFLFLSCKHAIREIVKRGNDITWQEAETLFAVLSILYLLQTREIWYVFLGIGLGASVMMYQQQHPLRRTKFK